MLMNLFSRYNKHDTKRNGTCSFLLLGFLADFVDTLYAWSAFNTEIIGEYLGYAILKLFESSYPHESIHLIGHSLGLIRICICIY